MSAFSAARTETDRPLPKFKSCQSWVVGDTIDHDTIHSTIHTTKTLIPVYPAYGLISFVASKDTYEPLHFRPVRKQAREKKKAVRSW
jgi:hypothetical protein